MRTILLVTFAAMFGGASVFFALRAFDQSPAEFELGSAAAELERKVDERLVAWREKLGQSRDQSPSGAEATPRPEKAGDTDRSSTGAHAPEAPVQEAAARLSPGAAAGRESGREVAEKQSGSPGENDRPSYARIGEGLAEAAAALERFNNALKHGDQSDER